MNFETFLVRDMNSLRDMQIDENIALLFDDISLANKTREEKIHIFDLENTSQVRVLYGIAIIPASTPRAFTTNKLDRVIGSINLDEIPKEIDRRITAVNIEEPLKICLKRTVIDEIEITFPNKK
jgi:hypothetical protein